VQPGDAFLLCSDGLSGQVSDQELGEVLGALPPQEAVRSLVDLANLRGGPDNITVIVARATPAWRWGTGDGCPAPAPPHPLPATWLLGISGLLFVATVLLGAADFKFAAAASLMGAGLAAGMAQMQRRGAVRPAADGRALGKGPHRSRECPAEAGFTARLADLAKELRQASVGSGWTIDWAAFDARESQAAAAVQAGDYRQAVGEYCRAISFMMAQLRSQREQQKPAGDGAVSG
jgi:hypothetical protein